MSKILKAIREFFIPLLDKAGNSQKPEISGSDIDIEDEKDLKIAFEMVQKIDTDEQDRNRTIETKSLIFIGSIGFVIAFIIGITNILLTSNHVYFSALTMGIVLTSSVLIAYFVTSSLYSIKALTRQRFQVLKFEEVIKADKSYLKELIAKIINDSRENARTINLRVDYMTMAQEYFKRGIIALFIYSLFVFAVILARLKPEPNVITALPDRATSFLKSVNMPFVAIILLLLINTIMLSLIFKRVNHGK